MLIADLRSLRALHPADQRERPVIEVDVEEACLYSANSSMRAKLGSDAAPVERSALPTAGPMINDPLGIDALAEDPAPMRARHAADL